MEQSGIDVIDNFRDAPVEQWHADLQAVRHAHHVDLEEYALRVENSDRRS